MDRGGFVTTVEDMMYLLSRDLILLLSGEQGDLSLDNNYLIHQIGTDIYLDSVDNPELSRFNFSGERRIELNTFIFFLKMLKRERFRVSLVKSEDVAFMSNIQEKKRNLGVIGIDSTM